MQALTRLNPTDPVRFDGMNTILGEIEARDEDLLNKINVLSSERNKNFTLTELGFSDSDFSNEDFELNVLKIIQKIGANNHIHFYCYNGSFNNINQSIKAYLKTGIDGFGVVVDSTSNTACSNPIYVYPNNTSDVYLFNYDNSLRYSGKLVTTSKTEIPIPFNSGFQAGHNSARCFIRKNGLNQVELYLSCSKVDGTAFKNGDIIATLPVGYRPNKSVCTVGNIAGIHEHFSYFIGANGQIKLEISSRVQADAKVLYGTVIYSLD